MLEAHKQTLNDFFVDTFNSVMDMEERALARAGRGDLSVKETHVLDAVKRLSAENGCSMSRVAARLGVTTGALTTAVATLARKGYLMRGGDASDRRLVLVRLTPEGEAACRTHAAFHEDMIRHVGEVISDEAEMATLAKSLDRLSAFFKSYAK